MERKEAKSCCCSCTNTLAWIAVILSACTLIGGAALGTCIYKKVNTLHKIGVELPYGSAENVDKLYDAYMTEDNLKEINENIDNQVAQMKGSQVESSDVESNLETPSNDEWDATSEEAYNLFGLSGTPGNAVINTETRMFKAVGGAYPQSAFEAAIAAVQDGSATTDDMGNAGTLTEEQLSALLDGVYYKDDKSNAKIIIVEYSDLLCPFCKRHYNDRSLENIVDEDDTIALVFKNMPIPSLHPNAPLGAKGVDCAGKLNGSKAYYEFLDAAMAESDFSLNGIAAIADKLGLDANEFAACYNS